MSINFKDSILTVKEANNIKYLEIKYFVSKNLIKTTYEDNSIKIAKYCKELLPYNSTNSIKCINCDNEIFNSIKSINIIYNLNYNYIDSIDVLSCHESHNNIYIEDYKLLNLLNINDFNAYMFKDHLKNVFIDNNNNVICTNCKYILGYEYAQLINSKDKEFVSLYIHNIYINNKSLFYDKVKNSYDNQLLLKFIIYEISKISNKLNSVLIINSNIETNLYYIAIDVKCHDNYVCNAFADNDFKNVSSLSLELKSYKLYYTINWKSAYINIINNKTFNTLECLKSNSNYCLFLHDNHFTSFAIFLKSCTTNFNNNFNENDITKIINFTVDREFLLDKNSFIHSL